MIEYEKKSKEYLEKVKKNADATYFGNLILPLNKLKFLIRDFYKYILFNGIDFSNSLSISRTIKHYAEGILITHRYTLKKRVDFRYELGKK